MTDKLIRSLLDGKCVVFLGTGTTCVLDAQGQTIPAAAAFAQKEAKNLTEISPEQAQNLHFVAQQLYDKNNVARSTFVKNMTIYFTMNAKKQRWHELLAALPLPLIINSNPDGVLQKAMETTRPSGIQRETVQMDWYNFKRVKESITTFSLENPLIYHLFGSFKDSTPDKESLVLTEQNVLHLATNIVRENPAIPNALLHRIRDKDAFLLFLGFDYEPYHLRLLFKTLDFQAPKDQTLLITGAHFPLQNSTQTFYEKEFNLQFLQEDLTVFLEKVQAQYDAQIQLQQQSSSNSNAQKTRIFILAHPNDNASSTNDQQGQYSFGLELATHLQNMPNVELSIYGHDTMMGNTNEHYTHQANQADIVILLLSAEFIGWNDYEVDNLKTTIIERFANDQTQLLLVQARACDWRNMDIMELGVSAPCPLDSNTHQPAILADYGTLERNKIYVQIVQSIQERTV